MAGLHHPNIVQARPGGGRAWATNKEVDNALLAALRGSGGSHGGSLGPRHCKVSRADRPSSQATCSWMMPVQMGPLLLAPALLQFLGVCMLPPAVVTELLPRGSLSEVVHQAAQSGGAELAAQLTWRRRLSMALDAARGMLYLHSRQPAILHRDLKARGAVGSRERAMQWLAAMQLGPGGGAPSSFWQLTCSASMLTRHPLLHPTAPCRAQIFLLTKIGGSRQGAADKAMHGLLPAAC